MQRSVLYEKNVFDERRPVTKYKEKYQKTRVRNFRRLSAGERDVVHQQNKQCEGNAKRQEQNESVE